MKNLDKDTLLYICEVLYSNGLGNIKGGATLVYELANSIDTAECGNYTIHWTYCDPCDTETPHLPEQDECLVCGSVYKNANANTNK